jgi:hypothetical protein
VASKAELDLREALLSTGMVQPVQVGGTKKKISALCREVPGQAKPWLQVVTNVLQAAAAAEVEIHICRQYVWKNDQMVFGWFVGFDCPSAKELTRRVNWLHDALRGVQPELVAPDAVTSVVAQPPPAAQDDEEEADPEAMLSHRPPNESGRQPEGRLPGAAEGPDEPARAGHRGGVPAPLQLQRRHEQAQR